jgi:hypothetical protein
MGRLATKVIGAQLGRGGIEIRDSAVGTITTPNSELLGHIGADCADLSRVNHHHLPELHADCVRNAGTVGLGTNDSAGRKGGVVPKACAGGGGIQSEGPLHHSQCAQDRSFGTVGEIFQGVKDQFCISRGNSWVATLLRTAGERDQWELELEGDDSDNLAERAANASGGHTQIDRVHLVAELVRQGKALCQGARDVASRDEEGREQVATIARLGGPLPQFI